jgi:hypothetical protein
MIFPYIKKNEWLGYARFKMTANGMKSRSCLEANIRQYIERLWVLILETPLIATPI